MSTTRPSFSFSGDRAQRGSVLIVALLLAAIIALMLGSYLNLNLSSTRLAKRSFQSYAALNLVEAGAEEAVWSFNRATGGQADAWTGWQNDGTSSWRKFDGFDLGQNTHGWVKVHVSTTTPPAGTNPKVVALASVNPPDGNPVTRMIEIALRRRSYFANGLVARDSIVFNGAVASVDSWDSDPDSDPSTPPVPYAVGIRRDNGTVASASVVNTAMLVNQANIWGYVFTGGAQPQVGTNGSIRGASTPADVMIDPNRIATDFNADFPAVSAPLDGTIIATVGSTLGTAGLATKWRCPAITLNGNKTLTILGDATLVLTAGPGVSALDVTGNASIIIPAGSSLILYTEGNVKIAGNGISNHNAQPGSFQLWGTSLSIGGQDMQIAGNGALKSVVYAPSAAVKINGNGEVMGSIVANTITLVGNAAFHYDEALTHHDAHTPFGIIKWREITSATERAQYQSMFDGW
ncbi:MAG: hypothetical protein KA257_07075 [Opitutaceae bacterium]|nr:hypothetical protein [Opitutaceae bacterium]